MIGSDPLLRLDATQVAPTLAAQAHGALAAEGCCDADIEAWSRAFLAEFYEGTVEDFIRWVHERGLAPCAPSPGTTTDAMLMGTPQHSEN
jgi:hypothetical protein